MTNECAVAGQAALTALCLAGADGHPGEVEVTPRPAERRVEVSVDGKPFTAYVWSERLAKPVLFPIRTARGGLVTRGFPLEPRPGEPADHPHQVGLWFSHGDVDGVDFWNNSDALPPARRAERGTIRHLAIEAARGGAGQGVLTVRHEWLLPGGRIALREKAAYVFGAGPDRRTIDRTTTLTAAEAPVVFRDNKEGLFALRVARELEEPSARYTSSEGAQGAAVWGSRARWLALAGRLGDEDVVLLMLDHPGNPGHPTHWHARGYGLFAANPLGQRVFSNGKQQLDLSLAKGASVRFRHRLLILSAPFSAQAAETAWRRFAAERLE